MGAKVEWGKNDVTVTGPGGKLTPIDVNMNKMPDAAMTLAVAAFADGAPHHPRRRELASERDGAHDRDCHGAPQARLRCV